MRRDHDAIVTYSGLIYWALVKIGFNCQCHKFKMQHLPVVQQCLQQSRDPRTKTGRFQTRTSEIRANAQSVFKYWDQIRTKQVFGNF